MEQFEQYIYEYNFTELRILMQYPSKQNHMREIISKDLQRWIENVPQQNLHYQQWITNFITGNKMNAQLLLDNFHSNLIILTEDEKINKTFLIFVHNMLKSGINKEYFLFHSQFSSHIATRLKQSISQLEWLTYCLAAIFDQDYTSSYLELINSIEIMDLIFQLLQKTIDDKVYPSLIIGINPKSLDIRELYSHQNKIGIQLGRVDLEFLNAQLSEVQKFKFYSLITFMGGYNSGIQDLFFPQIFNSALENLKIEKDSEAIAIYLRFLANMVHINKQSWNVLKNDGIQYLKLVHLLDPIIHYTNVHDQNQQREWAMMIVRNLLECEELRVYLQDCK